jgi:hypothetical protein
VRAASSGHRATAKAARWSRDRGCNGHRILRRVLIDGRHPRSSRAVDFHEPAVTVALAASSHPHRIRRRSDEADGRGRGDRDVRGSVVEVPVGRKRPRSRKDGIPAPARQPEAGVLSIRRSGSGVVKTPESPVKPRGAQSPRGAHETKVATGAGNVRGDGCTQFIQVAEVDRTHRASCPLGGRKASWRSRQGASRREARSTA